MWVHNPFYLCLLTSGNKSQLNTVVAAEYDDDDFVGKVIEIRSSFAPGLLFLEIAPHDFYF